MKKKTVIEMDYKELETLVKKTYGQEYNFVEDEECGNDSSHSFNFEEETLDAFSKEQLQSFKAGHNPSYITGTLIQDMVNNKILEQGDYLITVC